MDAAATSTDAEKQGWWERRRVATVLVLLTAVPFLLPPIPPLVDLPAHMARYRVALDLAHSPELQRFFGYHWRLISNLGGDVLVVPLSRLVGLEPATKLLVVMLPLLTGAGLLRVARAAHGRVPPTFPFALLFALGAPLLFGFVNFVLSAALALLVFGWWLQRRSPWLLAVAAPVLFLAHVYGWAMLGVMVGGAVLGESLADRCSAAALFKRLLAAALPLLTALILLPFLARGGDAAFAEHWFDLPQKLGWLIGALRDRWAPLDMGFVVIVLVLVLLGWRRWPLRPALAGAAIGLGVAALALPYRLLDSSFADMRLFPYVLALAVLAIDPRQLTARTAARLAALGLAVLTARIGTLAFSQQIAAQDQAPLLAAIDQLPRGSRLASLVGQPCDQRWQLPRLGHLASMITVRRAGFSNDQWPARGINLLERRYRPSNAFDSDPSQTVQSPGCVLTWTVDDALAALPRISFDYVLLIGTDPPKPVGLAGLVPVWGSEGATLYRVQRPAR